MSVVGAAIEVSALPCHSHCHRLPARDVWCEPPQLSGWKVSVQGCTRFVEAGLLHPPQPVETVDELALRKRRGERHRHEAGVLFERDLDLRQKLVETDAVGPR